MKVSLPRIKERRREGQLISLEYDIWVPRLQLNNEHEIMVDIKHVWLLFRYTIRVSKIA